MRRVWHLPTLRSTVALLGLIALASCQHLGEAVFTGPLEAPEMQARAGGIWSRRLPCLNEAKITHRATTMWRISSQGDKCVEVRRLRYGTVPEGFIQDAQAKPLHPDITYDVHVDGWTAQMPNVPFQAWGRFTFQDGRWTKP